MVPVKVMGPVKTGDKIYASQTERTGVAVVAPASSDEHVLLGKVVEHVDYSNSKPSEIHMVKVRQDTG
jgi:hypothetical protein